MTRWFKTITYKGCTPFNGNNNIQIDIYQLLCSNSYSLSNRPEVWFDERDFKILEAIENMNIKY